jgi:hypothetical protein
MKKSFPFGVLSFLKAPKLGQKLFPIRVQVVKNMSEKFIDLQNRPDQIY